MADRTLGFGPVSEWISVVRKASCWGADDNRAIKACMAQRQHILMGGFNNTLIFPGESNTISWGLATQFDSENRKWIVLPWAMFIITACITYKIKGDADLRHTVKSFQLYPGDVKLDERGYPIGGMSLSLDPRLLHFSDMVFNENTAD
jgi:hypothetical protein